MDLKEMLPVGKHTVIVKSFFTGKSQEKGIPFFALRFENDDGYISQRFYKNELGRKQLEILFNRFEVKIAFYNDEGIEKALKGLVNKTISVHVIENNGYRSTIGWEKIKST